MTQRVSILNLSADIAASAARISASQAEKVQEHVDWDVNMQSSEKRLAPYRYELRKGGIIEIQQSNVSTNEPGAPHSGTGSAIWTASIGLARFLEWKYRDATLEEMQGYRCIEVGCGTGLVSLMLASLGANVVTTDIHDCITQHTIPNVEANRSSLEQQGSPLIGQIDVQELVWGSTPLEPFGSSWNMVRRCVCVCV
jgi:2-polyprenyl-3-methyl-5-hydroxy-6-metoxy-1,4-benzoquinol methylase